MYSMCLLQSCYSWPEVQSDR